LAAKGFLAMGGQIIDATIIAAPRQKLTLEEKGIIREGGTPEGWSRAKRAQKDCDARWTLKRGRTKPRPEGAQRQAIQIAVPIFGYKSHIGINWRYGLIRRWTVTDAAQHNSRSFPALLDPENTASRVWADTAYRTRRNLEVLERRGLSERMQFRRAPRRGLSEQQAKANASRARIRPGIEHTLCRAEAPHGAVRPHHRSGAGPGEDRGGQLGLQLHSPGLDQHPNCPCLTPQPMRMVAPAAPGRSLSLVRKRKHGLRR
jgi:hypothetical protein